MRTYELCDLADAIPHVEETETIAPASTGHTDNGELDKIGRAAKYLAKIPGAVQGQNGDNDTFKTACTLVNDFSLSVDQAWPLLAEWNQKCQPPWTETELREKLVNAKEYAKKPPGCKANAPPPAKRKPATGKLKLATDTAAIEQDARLDTDVGNAALFVLKHGDKVRFNFGPHHWLVWDGKRWKQDNCGAVMQLAKQTILDLLDEAKAALDEDERERLLKRSMKSQKRERIAAMIALAESAVAVNPSMLDADPWLFNCLSGTIDLRTGQLRPHRQDDLITKLAPVEYDPDAQCPRWDSVQNRTFGRDQSMIRFVQRWEGMSLTGDVREQKMPIYHGVGNNGKNIHLDTVCAVMGDYACEAPPNLLTMTKFSEHPTEIADLMGRRFVVASETEDSAQLRLQLVKRLTGNAKLKARFMRQDYFQFDRTFKLVLVTNNKPVVHEDSEATWRRLRLVPFNVVIPLTERDTMLMEKLKPEYPGILAWLVRGCLDWQREGLAEPDAVVQATAIYRSESDHLGQWLAECFDLRPEKWTPSQRLRQEYERWCEERGIRKLTGNTFTDKLSDRGFKPDRKQGQRGWYGLDFKV